MGRGHTHAAASAASVVPRGLESSTPLMSAVPPAGLESKKELMSEFVDGEFDPNDAKMFKLLGLDVLDEKKPKITADDIKLPVVRRMEGTVGRNRGHR